LEITGNELTQIVVDNININV